MTKMQQKINGIFEFEAPLHFLAKDFSDHIEFAKKYLLNLSRNLEHEITMGTKRKNMEDEMSR